MQKGGRTMSFSALVVVGDRRGRVGLGFGKAREVPMAVEKANKEARRNLERVSLVGTTIPHEVWGKYEASKIFLSPAAPGTGVIAGATVRAVMQAVGIRDILTKSFGSNTPINLARATFVALRSLRTKEQAATLRGVSF
ncbi:MAG: 30S ribosomal protein S5 [Planctomycetes bacterium]|nr:30S ribosomal protein S5 [Planctomycetota bacterium]